MHYGLCAEALSEGKLPVSICGIQERTTMQPAVPSERKILMILLKKKKKKRLSLIIDFVLLKF